MELKTSYFEYKVGSELEEAANRAGEAEAARGAEQAKTRRIR